MPGTVARWPMSRAAVGRRCLDNVRGTGNRSAAQGRSLADARRKNLSISKLTSPPGTFVLPGENEKTKIKKPLSGRHPVACFVEPWFCHRGAIFELTRIS
jgi:hypothetical protein